MYGERRPEVALCEPTDVEFLFFLCARREGRAGVGLGGNLGLLNGQ